MNANLPTTIDTWLQGAQSALKRADVPSYQLDSLLLLEHATELDRAHILAHGDKSLSKKQLSLLDAFLKERINRKPIAYITNSIEFYGRLFYVDENVLIPRPESEAFIELVKDLPVNLALLDVGCGSGVLGINAKLEQPSYHVMLSDISPHALHIARKNAETLHAEVNTIRMDLLSDLPANIDVIIANLPYVPQDMKVEPELMYEPSVALFSSNHGLAHYQQLWVQLAKIRPRYVMTESLAHQHERMNIFAKQASYSHVATRGLVKMFELA